MLKIYGSDLCPDCLNFKSNLDANGIEYVYIDINKRLRDLKDFLKLRDSLPVFDHCKEVNSIGLPCLIDENGTVSLDWEAYLKDKGLEVRYLDDQVIACSLDKKGC